MRNAGVMNRSQETSAHRIVVGVDGSEASKVALKWAVRQAELTGAALQVVTAWHYPAMIGGYGWAPVSMVEIPNFDEIAEKVVRDAVTEVVGPQSGVHVSTTVFQGNAAQALLDAAKGADLLVVGSRGHGGFSGALLGSVSQHCAHYSPCPIVIIRNGVPG